MSGNHAVVFIKKLVDTMHERDAEILYFAEVPALHDLCLVVASVPTSYKLGSGKQPHIIRCRELIFTEPDILATPSFGHEQSVQIIMQQSLYRTGRLQSRFQKMGLQVEKPRRVTPAIFQSCYRYTLLAKLAPGWNKMGDDLVQGRDFVMNSEKMNAICLDATVTEREVCLAVQAHIIRSSPIKLADLGVCRPMWNTFIREAHGKIAEYSICNKWCHVLPSMKKGKIVNLVRKIPQDSPFKTYKDIKRYWKNMYGYRLPETDEGMIYYQVYFKPIGNVIFTYPECCVRAREALVFARTDPRPILHSFFAEFHEKLPSVCGRKLQFATKAKYHTAGFLSVYEAEDIIQSSVVNLTEQVPTHLQQPCMQSINRTLQPTRWAGVAQLIRLSSGPTTSLGTTDSSDYTATTQQQQEQQLQEQQWAQQQHMQCAKRVVPVFRVKNHQQPSGAVTPHSQPQPKRVPVFQATKSRSSVVSPRDNIAHSQCGTLMLHLSPAEADCIPPTQFTAANRCLVATKQTDCSTKKPVFLKKPSKLFNNATSSGQKPPRQSGTVVTKTPEQMTVRNTSLSFSSTSNVHLSHSLTVTGQTAHTPTSANMPHIAGSSGKRKLDFPESDAKAKKPRAKPKVQEDIDVEALVKANQLAKVNTVTLLTWLRDKGVACKSKDKKGDLVEKVMHTLSLVVVEQ